MMPFLIKGPGIKPGSVCKDIVQNVDFAPTWLEFAGIPQPSSMQGGSFLPALQGRSTPQHPDTVAYHRYWMHCDDIHNTYVRCNRDAADSRRTTRVVQHDTS